MVTPGRLELPTRSLGRHYVSDSKALSTSVVDCRRCRIRDLAQDVFSGVLILSYREEHLAGDMNPELRRSQVAFKPVFD